MPLISSILFPPPVGATLDGLFDASDGLIAQSGALRAENRMLHRDIEKTASRIGELEKEVFKYIVQK